jgi:hypothetical protein
MELAIPGFGTLRLEHLVLDYNGTLALDGRRCPADLLAPSVTDALDVFLQPRRLLASLRS